ncbi:helix-turn-helix domain-containing protein [Aggregatilineales bacterium SYSU G02658]
MDTQDSIGSQDSGSVPQQKDLRAVHDSMLDGLGQLADYFGFSKVMGQLYGTLLLNDGPLSLDDIMQRLNISKANVSMNIRSLELLGFVRQVWVRGGNGRRKYYEAETDFWKILTNVISGREMRDIARTIEVLDDNSQRLFRAMPEMTEAEQETARLYVQRMAQLQVMFRFAQVLIANVLAQSGQNMDELLNALHSREKP